MLHLFALLGREEEVAERLSYLSLKRSSASAFAPTNSAAHSWSYGHAAEGRHRHHPREQCVECGFGGFSSTTKICDT